MHLERLEAMARRAPHELAQRADAAIARHVPALAPSRLRKRFRRRTVAVFVMLGLMALMASAWAVLRETTILREAMESQLSERFGGLVRIKKVKWDGWNRITATNMDLRARGWEGDAATVASMDRAKVVFSPMMLLLGRIELVDMEVEGLALHLVERADKPGDFNFLALKPKSGGGTSVRQPQKALLRDLRLEFGTSTGGTVTTIASQQFAADFDHLPDDPSTYSFRLEQREQDGAPITDNAIRLFGTWNERDFTYAATLDALVIDERLLRALPAKARRWALRSGLAGRIERARIEGSPSQPLRSMDIAVRDVTLRERDAVRELAWARMENGKTTSISGELGVFMGEANVTLRGNDIRVDAKRATLTPGPAGSGTVAVPLELSGHCDLGSIGGIEGALDADDAWLERSLAMASFELDLRIPQVDARPAEDGTPRRVELPVQVTDALTVLGARDWAANITLRIARPAGKAQADGVATSAPIAVTGKLELLGGTIESPEFPYPVRDVGGVVELTAEKIQIRGLKGNGNGGCIFRIDGESEIEGKDPAYSLRLVGTDVLLDRSLVSAFGAGPSRIFGALLDEQGWRSLRQAGILEEETRPGGVVDVDFSVKHARDGGDHVEVGGTIGLRGVQVVLNAFPYPLLAVGTLEVRDDRVNLLGDGIAVQTIHGSKGWIRGHLELPRIGDRVLVRSYLDFQVSDEIVSRALLAAIPVSFEDRSKRPAGWPGAVFSPISNVLTELGLGGKLSATGTVITRPDESDAVTVRVQIEDGVIRPTEDLATALRKNGLSWPGRMTLDDVRSLIIADAGRVDVRDASATHGTGIVTANGGFDLEGDNGTLEVILRNFPFDRELVRVADGDSVDRALAAWDAIAPSGTFDGEVTWNRDGGGRDTYAHVHPTAMTLAGEVKLDPVCGDLYYRNGELRLDSVDLRGPDTDETPLRIEAGGVIIGAHPDFRAQVTALSLGNPLVRCGLEASGATAALEILRDWRLQGAIDAQVELPGTRTGGSWEVVVEPSWIRGERNERPFEVRRRAGALLAGPQGLKVDALDLTFDQGHLSIDGALGPTESSTLVGQLTISASAANDSESLRALMPSSARRSLEAIEFSAGSAVWTDATRLLIDVPREGSNRVSVIGDLGIANARFKGGVTFDQIDGLLRFDITTVGGEPAGSIGLQFDQVHALGRRATDIHGDLLFESDTGRVRLEDLSAGMYGGRIAARGMFDRTDGWDVHLACANIGFGRFVAAGQAPSADTKQPVAGSDGQLRGRIDVAGRAGDPLSRRGSGKMAVADARMMEFPLGMSFLQLTQLMLPLNASMEDAFVDFELGNDRITLRQVDLSSGTLKLEGTGEINTDTQALALRFRNRGKVPILSDLYGVVTDQFFAIDVGGTLNDPQPRLTPIPVFAPAPMAPAAGATAEPSTSEATDSPKNGTETR